MRAHTLVSLMQISVLSSGLSLGSVPAASADGAAATGHWVASLQMPPHRGAPSWKPLPTLAVNVCCSGRLVVLALPAFICLLRIGLLLQKKSQEAEGIGLIFIHSWPCVGFLGKICVGDQGCEDGAGWAQTGICCLIWKDYDQVLVVN